MYTLSPWFSLMIIWINYNVFSNFVIRNMVRKTRLNMIDQYYFIPYEYNLSPHSVQIFYTVDFLLLGDAKNPRNINVQSV